MSATPTEIRQGIADALGVIPGLQAKPYALAAPTPPFAHVLRGDVQYDQAMQGGTHLWTMRVQAGVGLATDQGSQALLDSYLSADGAQSIKQAIEADTSLGGIVADLHVESANGEQVYVRDQGGPVLGSEWTVQVWL